MADADTVASPFPSAAAALGEQPRKTSLSFLPANLVGIDSNISFAPAAAATSPFTLGHRHCNGPLLFSEGAHKPRTPPSAGSTRCRLRQVGRMPTSRDRLNRTMAMFNISAGGDVPTVPMPDGSIGVQCDFSKIYETEEHANKENIFNVDILGDASKLPENKRVFVDTILGGAALPRPSSNKRSHDAYAYAYASLETKDEVKIEKAGKKEEQAPKRARRGRGPVVILAAAVPLESSTARASVPAAAATAAPKKKRGRPCKPAAVPQAPPAPERRSRRTRNATTKVAAPAAAAPAALAPAAAASAQPAGEWGGRLRTRKSRA